MLLVSPSCPTPCHPMSCSPPGSWYSPGKNTGEGCHFLSSHDWKSFQKTHVTWPIVHVKTLQMTCPRTQNLWVLGSGQVTTQLIKQLFLQEFWNCRELESSSECSVQHNIVLSLSLTPDTNGRKEWVWVLSLTPNMWISASRKQFLTLTLGHPRVHLLLTLNPQRWPRHHRMRAPSLRMAALSSVDHNFHCHLLCDRLAINWQVP